MRITRTPGGKSLILLTVLAGGAVLLSATVTYAGFQWVPPTAEAPKAENNAMPPAASLAPAPVPPASETVLPLPGGETPQAAPASGLYDPAVVPPAPVAAAPAPVLPIPAAPQLKPADTADISPAQRALAMPPGDEALPLLPPEENQVIKVREVSPPPSPNSAPLSITDTRQPVPESVTMQNLSPPAAMEPPAPMVAQPKVIMPQDAPQTAMDNTPNSQKLVIDPRPRESYKAAAGNDPVQNTLNTIVQDTAAQSDMPVIEGFGSDMPLALALQQIMPAGYAASFDPGVNPGQTVSWDGGKPWDQVISNMLTPLQLQAVIGDKIVYIRSQGGWRQGDAAPAANNGLRRANIKDPGELAGIEAAAGEPQATSVPAIDSFEPLKNTAGPAAEIETLPAPTELGTQEVSASPEPSTEAQQQEQTEQLLASAPVATPTLSVKTNAGPWEAKAGESLKDILTRWSEKAGVELIWMASYDYKLKDDVVLQENFSEAVETVMKSGLEENAAPDFQIVQKPGDETPGGILIRDKRA
ncbi:MAG: TcpQ domain-containing protein [Alphaproteobacteria bacterium]